MWKTSDCAALKPSPPPSHFFSWAEQTAIYNDTIGYIDHVINSNPGCYFVLLGDFNCNIYNAQHPFSPIVQEFISRRRLTCTFDLKDSFDPNTAFTRTNYGAANSGSLLDYIFVSDELKNFTSNVIISHYSDNFSDHLPVTVDIELSILKCNNRQKQTTTCFN